MRRSGVPWYWLALLLTSTANAMPGMDLTGLSSATPTIHGRQGWAEALGLAGNAIGRDACQSYRTEHGTVCRRVVLDRKPLPDGDAQPGCRGCHGGLVDRERISLRYASYVPGRDTDPRHCDTCHGGSHAAHTGKPRTGLDPSAMRLAGNYLPIAKPYRLSAGRLNDCKDCHIVPRGD